MKATILPGIIIAFATVAFAALPAQLGLDGARPEGVSAGSPIPGAVNCDGTVNAIDAALVLQFSAGLLGALPEPRDRQPCPACRELTLAFSPVEA